MADELYSNDDDMVNICDMFAADKYDDLYQYVATFADQANGSYCQVY